MTAPADDSAAAAAFAARVVDPALDAGARRRLDAMKQRMKAAGGVNDMAQALQDPRAPVPLRRHLLVQITDRLGKAMAGVAPCREGCAQCCHIPTLITVPEAEALARASGRPLTMPPPELFSEHAPIQHWRGVPCPFLAAGGRCGVYAARPHACRVHYSMDRDNLLCDLRYTGDRMPHLNNDQFNILALLSYGDPRSVRFAEMRDFFPAA